MSDSTHCQLLHSPLSSSAFLNMHALHFPTTFQIQMDVPCSRLYSLPPFLLSPPASALRNSALFVADPIFPGLIHPAVLRQTARAAH